MMTLGYLEMAITNAIERITANIPMKIIHGSALIRSGKANVVVAGLPLGDA